jgi:sigma-B regulation protein RsbU (phosphoserine phosphatase)
VARVAVPIRWKLLLLLLSLALLPMLGIAVFDVRALSALGANLAAQTGQALAEHARDALERQADDYTRWIAGEQRALELAVRLQATAIEHALRDAPPPDAVIAWDDDFAQRGDALDLKIVPDKYVRQTVAPTAVPVSFTQMVMRAAPGVDRARLQPEAARLTTVTATLAEIQRRYSEAVYWQYAAFEDGLHASYPGHGGYPDNFNSRRRAWYRDQASRQTLTWSRPHVDAISRLTMVTVTMPLFDALGNFVGVTGIDVRLTRLLQAIHLPAHLATRSQVLLTALGPEVTTRTIVTVARQSQTEAGGDWQEQPALERFATDSTADTAEIAGDMYAGRDGFLRTRYRDQDVFCVYRRFNDRGTYVVFIVPTAAASRPAADAAAYALDTTQRQINAVIPLVLVVAAVVAFAALLSARAVTGPIGDLSQAVDQVAGGDFDVRVDIRSGDELEQLGVQFNRMVPQMAAHARMRESLALAREVQQRLLPSVAPRCPGLDIAGICRYADETGGDYFDYLDLRPQGVPAVAIAIGDVSGHGVASALLMSSARALLHADELRPGRLAATFEKLNVRLGEDVEKGRFMTLAVLIFDLSTRQLDWAGAGHEAVLCYHPSEDRFSELTSNDIPLGIDPHWRYTAGAQQPYQSGDIFVLTTDGVREARAATGEHFGQARLRATLRAHAALPAAGIRDALLAAIESFRGHAPAHDDLTLVVVKIVAGGTEGHEEDKRVSSTAEPA